MSVFTHRQWIAIAATSSMMTLSFGGPAFAGLSLDPSNFGNPSAFLTPEIVNPVIKTVGLTLDHRPFEPATSLGTKLGVDIGIEVSLVRVPDDLGPALQAATGGGSGGGGPSTPQVLPVPRVHLHKGLGPIFGIGLSAIYYQGYRVYGGDAKLTFLQPEEGPTWAFRFCYTSADVKIASTHTYTPQLVVSRALEFADPYMGIGYQLTFGEINIPINVPELGQSVNITAKGRARSLMAFIGIQFKVPWIGLALALEGSYSQVGMHGLGTKVGFSF